MANSEGGHLERISGKRIPDGAFLATLAREIVARGEALLQAGRAAVRSGFGPSRSGTVSDRAESTRRRFGALNEQLAPHSARPYIARTKSDCGDDPDQPVVRIDDRDVVVAVLGEDRHEHRHGPVARSATRTLGHMIWPTASGLVGVRGAAALDEL